MFTNSIYSYRPLLINLLNGCYKLVSIRLDPSNLLKLLMDAKYAKKVHGKYRHPILIRQELIVGQLCNHQFLRDLKTEMQLKQSKTEILWCCSGRWRHQIPTKTWTLRSPSMSCRSLPFGIFVFTFHPADAGRTSHNNNIVLVISIESRSFTFNYSTSTSCWQTSRCSNLEVGSNAQAWDRPIQLQDFSPFLKCFFSFGHIVLYCFTLCAGYAWVCVCVDSC